MLLDDTDLIRNLHAQCSRLADDGDFAAWTGLFAEGAAFVLNGGQTRLPIADMVPILEEQRASDVPRKHILVNSVVGRDGPDRGWISSDFMLVATTDDGGAELRKVGRYHDVVVKQGDAWLVEERRLLG